MASEYSSQTTRSRSDDESLLSPVDEAEMTVLSSPAGLVYEIDQLPASKRTVVRETFTEPPTLALQQCRQIGDTYAFQMSELVTRSVRIRRPGSGGPRLSCSCGRQEELCKHLVLLLDQIAKQCLYDHDGTRPLTMGADGYATDMAEPFHAIAQHHLAVLADGLHCPVMEPPLGLEEAARPDAHRVMEARELLASLYDLAPDDFRRDLAASPSPEEAVLAPRDLERTVFRMLLDNALFFRYFCSLARLSDTINDGFWKLRQRADRVLGELDAYALQCSEEQSRAPAAEADAQADADADAAGPVEPAAGVAWAAAHLVGCVRLVRGAIFTRSSPLEPREALSAAHTLVHLLEAVVARHGDAHPGPSRASRNLYFRLIGDSDRDFVIAELALIPEAASHQLHCLDHIHDRIGLLGAPVSYAVKLRTLLARLRKSTVGAGLKRPSSSQASDAKRIK